MDDARKDADRAVQLNPKNADAWLERGVIRHAKGDKAGAEADWRQATQAAPDSPAAKAAAANLNQGGPKP
jgi:regulator of sirC expression with transglutaminase-like and TPR domain